MTKSMPQSQIWTAQVTQATQLTERADLAILEMMEKGLGKFSAEPLPQLTRSQLKRLIEEGHVKANGNPIKSHSKLSPGAVIEIELPQPRPSELVPENRPLEILFEDEYLLVLNKPPGLTVHPSPTQMEGTLVHALLHHVRDLSGIGGVLRPGIVHRIDKNTSGALVITKTDQAHLKLSDIFSRHQIERSYWALCYGSPAVRVQQKPIRIESLIGRSPTDRKKMSMKVREGRKAISYYKKLEEFSQPHHKPFASFLEVTLETGRTHQVRVHLTGLGHSILGDPTYGLPSDKHTKWVALPQEVRSAVSELPGQALHAHVLGFEHPITGIKLHFEALPPPAFQKVLQALQKYSKQA